MAIVGDRCGPLPQKMVFNADDFAKSATNLVANTFALYQVKHVTPMVPDLGDRVIAVEDLRKQIGSKVDAQLCTSIDNELKKFESTAQAGAA